MTAPGRRRFGRWAAPAWCVAAGLAVSGAAPGADIPTPGSQPSAPHAVRTIGGGAHEAEFLSPVYTLDHIYRSMTGPGSQQRYRLLESAAPELLWITGYESTVVDPERGDPLPQEFMCHTSFGVVDWQAFEGWLGVRGKRGRLFTLGQGQSDLALPRGFGIPIRSGEPVELDTMALNANVADRTMRVRLRVTVRFIRDAERAEPIAPLYSTNLAGLKLLNGAGGGYWNVEDPDPGRHGPGCLIGEDASGSRVYTDAQGRRFTGHWVVKPGREVNRTLVTSALALPYDTTLHYAAVHLHPYAESLELRDLTTGTPVFMSRARSFPNRVGLESVEHVTSPEGIPMYKNHEYELVSVYNNTSGTDQDAMASVHLYFRNQSWRPVND